MCAGKMEAILFLVFYSTEALLSWIPFTTVMRECLCIVPNAKVEILSPSHQYNTLCTNTSQLL